MKRAIYLLHLMLSVAYLCSCTNDPLQMATDIELTPVYNLHSNSDDVLLTNDKELTIYNIYIYREVAKVSEVSGIFDANIRVHAIENYEDNSNDDFYDISFIKVYRDEIYDDVTGEFTGYTPEERTKYVIWGYKDRDPYLIAGGDTPDTISDDVYTRGELYIKVYTEDGETFLYGSQTLADDETTNKTEFALSGLKIFEEYRTIAK